MSVVGIGIDVVEMARFERALSRTPTLASRLFTDAERVRPLRSLAVRFAAKEALVKALGGSGPLRWKDMEIVGNENGDPDFLLFGVLADHIRARGIDSIHLSMSHDGGIATAFVVLEREAA